LNNKLVKLACDKGIFATPSAEVRLQADAGFAGKLLIDGRECLFCQLVLFQPVAKSQNCGLIGQAGVCI
jgi:hypothetical protein